VFPPNSGKLPAEWIASSDQGGITDQYSIERKAEARIFLIKHSGKVCDSDWTGGVIKTL